MFICNLVSKHFFARKFSSKASEELWKLSTYKYFLPLQTRFKDNDAFNHVNFSEYHNFSGTATMQFIYRNCQSADTHKNYSVQSNCVYRSALSFPEVVLIGMSVGRIGNTSVQFFFSFFKPKLAYPADPVKDTGVSLHGSFADDVNLQKVAENYHKEAAAVVDTVQVFVDAASQLPKPFNEATINSFNKILAPQ